MTASYYIKNLKFNVSKTIMANGLGLFFNKTSYRFDSIFLN